jgi:flagellar hook protein FlgE
MMRSMYSGVSGLRVHQTKMDVIGNNIANVNTVGFKSQRVTFNEVFSQTLQSASGASDETGRGGRNPMQVGLGVNVASIDLKMTTGAAQRTDNPFDLMVDGNGFIIVGDNNGTYFTRAGALRVDDDGNLVIPNGMKVMGWQPTDDTGKEIQRSEVSPININKFRTSEPTATTATSLTGNINVNDGVDGIVTQIKMYDSLGNYYTTNISLEYDPTATPPVWNASFANVNGTDVILTDADGNNVEVAITSTAPATFPGIGTFSFDVNGKLEEINGAAITNPSFTFNVAPLGNAVIGEGAAGAVTLAIGAITQYSAKTDLNPKTLNGASAGKLTGYAVGGDGIVTATYDNGATKMLGQVVVAEFENPAGLQKVGDNLFQVTSNSGEFDNIGKAGVFIAGVLEMSNVDLAGEFTEMITTQRGFQANSKIISASDEMLQTLVNMR